MKKVEVTASQELEEMRLGELIGKKGKIVGQNEHNTGYFVELDEPFQNYKEWFVPKASLKNVKC